MDWTFELTQKLRRLAKKGKTASEIAEIMGDGVTKNMVISRAYRARPRIHLVGPAAETPALPSIVPAAKPRFVILEELEPGPLHDDDLRPGDSRCRYPLWPDRIGTKMKPRRSELFYCGKRTKPGQPWCEECRKKVYEPAMTKSVKPGEGRKVDKFGRRVGWQYGT